MSRFQRARKRILLHNGLPLAPVASSVRKRAPVPCASDNDLAAHAEGDEREEEREEREGKEGEAATHRRGAEERGAERRGGSLGSRPSSMDEQLQDGLLRHNSIELLSPTEQQVVRIERVRSEPRTAAWRTRSRCDTAGVGSGCWAWDGLQSRTRDWVRVAKRRRELISPKSLFARFALNFFSLFEDRVHLPCEPTRSSLSVSLSHCARGCMGLVQYVFTSLKLNSTIRVHSKRAALVLVSLPPPPQSHPAYNYMEYMDLLLKDIPRALLVRVQKKRGMGWVGEWRVPHARKHYDLCSDGGHLLCRCAGTAATW
jgi:hypothetical protein